MYCCLCGNHLEIAKLRKGTDYLNKTKRIQIACPSCDIHINKIVKENYSDEKAVKQMTKEFKEYVSRIYNIK